MQAAPEASGFLAWAQGHTLELAMTTLLLLVAVYTILGSMLSVLVTDFLQFIVMSAGLIVVTVMVLLKIGWGRLVATIQAHYGAGGFNPFVNPQMGWQYVLFNALLNLAAVLTWMAVIQRVLAAKDSSTGRKIYTRTSFFFVARFLIPGIWGIAALAVLGAGAGSLQAMPRFLSTFVPAGVMGLVIAAIVFGAVLPVLYLVLEQVPATSAWVRGNIGPYYSGIATYLLAGLAMVVGSLLKPGWGTAMPQGEKP